MRAMMTLAAALAVVATPALAENWNRLSNTDRTTYFADVDSVTAIDGGQSIRVARVPRAGAAGDYSHEVEVYEFQCADSRFRTAGITEYGEDGAEIGAYPEADGEWSRITRNSLPDILKGVVCEGDRSPQVFPTLAAYIDAGRS